MRSSPKLVNCAEALLVLKAVPTASAIVCASAGGMPTGPNSAYHWDPIRPGMPSSPTVGVAGRCASLRSEVIARAINLPALTCSVTMPVASRLAC
jgi:hypothetical protein